MSSMLAGMIFDLDGTLLDSLQDLADCYNRVLARFGFPTHPVESYRYFIGEGARRCMQLCLPEDETDEATVTACLQVQRRDYADNWRSATRPYPGITDLLERLTEMQIPFAVLSNKDHRFTQKLVQHFFADFRFSAVQGLDGTLAPKPAPDGARLVAGKLDVLPSSILFAGDSSMDMIAASTAGQTAVGVLWGFRDRKELLEAGADELIDKPSDLLALVTRLIQQENPTHG